MRSKSKTGIDLYTHDLHLLSYQWGGRPYIHPLRTPGGHTISLLKPYDHQWHLGLFFSWTYVNGINFCGEADEGGKVTQTSYSLKNGKGFIEIHSRNHWADRSQVLLEEARAVTVHAPTNNYYFIDFHAEYRPQVSEVMLDCIPATDQTSLSGYSGLAFRPVRSMYEHATVINSNGTTGSRTNGERAEWVHYQGKLDGGKDRMAGIAIFDHPVNPRHPSPFVTMDSSKRFGFLSSSILFHEPYVIGSGSSLMLNYRLLIHDHAIRKEEIDRHYRHYLQERKN